MTVNKLTSPISQNDLINKTNEIIDNLGGGGATDVQINGTSITSGGVANIVTNTAYNASSNKIATMSDLPADKIFIATYNTTTYNEVLTAYNAGKTLFCLYVTTDLQSLYYKLERATSTLFVFSLTYQSTWSLNNDLLAAAISRISITSQNSWYKEDGNLESQYNKTTLISSSSTDAQYPSAKLLYDQLALKQNTSTAVTHTANTAVGNSTTPVYINSSGVATSTGLSIASSRFDGQWVLFSDTISLSTATSATTTDVTSTIKTNMGTAGTDSYKYELLIQAYCNYKSATAGLLAITTNQTVYLITVSSGTTLCRFFGIIPVYFDKVLKFQRTAAMDACTIYFCGYRRIGTNS